MPVVVISLHWFVHYIMVQYSCIKLWEVVTLNASLSPFVIGCQVQHI